jgi:peptide-methionine (S)-S-oxide reductase
MLWSFYPAAAYHQYFYEKTPVGYSFYRYNWGRDQRTKDLWGEQA